MRKKYFTSSRQPRKSSVRCTFFTIVIAIAALYTFFSLLRKGRLKYHSPIVRVHNSHEHLIFAQYGALRPHEVISFVYARKSHPGALIWVLAHEPLSSVDTWTTLEAKYNITVVKYNIYTETAMHMKFRRYYLHSSVHPTLPPVGFDYFAQARFISLAHLMSSKEIDNAIFLDTDILLFDNVFDNIPVDMTLTHFSDYATHWTQQSVQDFAEYLIYFYSRQNLSAIAMDIVTFGERNPDLAPALDSNEAIGAWWPSDIARHHFSDMHIFGAFLTESKKVQTLCPSSGCPETLIPLANLHGSAKCNNISDVKNAFQWRPSNNLPLVPFLKDEVVPALHFQGECKALIVPGFCQQAGWTSFCAD